MAADRDQQKLAGTKAPSPSQTVLRDGLFAAEVGVWRWTVQTGELVWSENLEAIHRLPPGRFGGTFESFVADIHPDDHDRVLATIQAALSGGDGYSVQYRLPPGPLGSVRWIEARGRVLRDAKGAPVHMTGICHDITAHKNTELELGLRARQQEALAHLGELGLSGASLDEIFGEAVRIVADLAEADFTEVLELASERETLTFRAGHGWNAPGDGEPAATSEPGTPIGDTLRSRRPVVVTDFDNDERFERPRRLAAHGIQSGASVVIPGNDGNPFGALAVWCQRIRCISETDVRFLRSVANILGSAIRAANDQERRELLIGELRHRVGNLFSLVQALHRQTGQSAHDARDLELKFGARLAALASAHSLILEGGWHKASLRKLLETALSPFIERVEFTGTDVQVPAEAAFSFSMALHEMATNAAKYGAFSVPDGRLHIDTRAAPDALGEKLALVWKECDGPPPPEAGDEGFGSKLIAQVVERQLGGQVTRTVERDGLRFTIEFPVR
jgi:two-component sensor histidine kinase